ncbi:DUF1830 domain-containing protein [Microcoleus sp. FACHB-1515]|nr:DUF1830 domain-containing protein [Microcoleus sp. FACHB-1515]
MEISVLPLVANHATTGLCYYQNATSQVQLLRIRQTLEKVIFPGDRILFHAAPEDTLDIYSSTPTGFMQIDRIACSQLQVIES